jgi:hypothetical protein
MSLQMLTDEVADDGSPEEDSRSAQNPERLDTDVSPAKMQALRKVAERALDAGTVFGTPAQIGPATVDLRTNEYALFQRWSQNWAAPDRDENIRSDGAVVVALGLENEEPAAYYCRQTGQVTLLNLGDYAQCRRWTLTMAADAAAREDCAGLQAAALELNGRGTLIACRDEALLAAAAIVLALDHGAAVQNLTWAWLSAAQADEPAAVHRAERMPYLPPNSRQWDGRLGALAGKCTLPGLDAAPPGKLPVQQFITLEHEPEADGPECQSISAARTLSLLRSKHWATPPLALPPHPGHGPVLEAALAGAHCLHAVLTDGALRALCQALATGQGKP